MALTVLTSYPAKGLALASWDDLANGNTGNSASIARWADKTVQVSGTFGVGGSITIQGSNDATVWATLHDPQGNDLTFTAAGIEMITENPLHIRPNVTAGDGTTALDVDILGRDD